MRHLKKIVVAAVALTVPIGVVAVSAGSASACTSAYCSSGILGAGWEGTSEPGSDWEVVPAGSTPEHLPPIYNGTPVEAPTPEATDDGGHRTPMRATSEDGTPVEGAAPIWK